MSASEEKPLDEFCQVSSCMGIIDCYEAKSIWGKIFWALIIFVCLCLTLWQTRGVFLDFANATYKTSISTDSISEMEFPSVIICNVNRAKQSLINKTSLDRRVLEYIFQLFDNNYLFPLRTLDGLNVSEYEQVMKTYTNNGGYNDPIKFLEFYMHNEKETFMQKAFRSRKYEGTIDTVLTIYGLCFKVDSNATVPNTGATTGLTLMINPKLEEYMNEVIYNNYLQEGLVVSVGYVTEPHMPAPLFVSPGSYASIGLTTSKYSINFEQIPLLSPLCNAETTLQVVDAKFTPKNCYFDCKQATILNYCGCMILTPQKTKYPLCNLTTILQCANSAVTMFETVLHSGVDPKQSNGAVPKTNGSIINQPNASLPNQTNGQPIGAMTNNNQTSGSSSGNNRPTSASSRNPSPSLNGTNSTQSQQQKPLNTDMAQAIRTCLTKCLNPCDDLRLVSSSMSTTKAISTRIRSTLANTFTIPNADDEKKEAFFDKLIVLDIYFDSLLITTYSTGEEIPIFAFIGNLGGQLGLWIGISFTTLVQFVYYLIWGISINIRKKFKRKAKIDQSN